MNATFDWSLLKLYLDQDAPRRTDERRRTTSTLRATPTRYAQVSGALCAAPT